MAAPLDDFRELLERQRKNGYKPSHIILQDDAEPAVVGRLLKAADEAGLLPDVAGPGTLIFDPPEPDPTLGG